MGEKNYEKLIEELIRKGGASDFHIYEKKPDSYDYGDWYERKEVEIKQVPISIEDVMRKFKPEELIEAIGIEKVESVLRAHKIKKLKKQIQK